MLLVKNDFPITCDGWLSEEEQPIKGIEVFSLNVSKTPGELSLLMGNKTLDTGDIILAHWGVSSHASRSKIEKRLGHA